MTTTLPNHTSPLRVPEISGKEDSNDIYFARWEKYNALPEETKKFLESEETATTIYKIQKFRNLSDETTANIARVVRGYYFGDLKEFDFVPYLMRDSAIDQAAAARLAQLIVKEIIESKLEKTTAQHESDKEAKDKQSLPLLKALSLYPMIDAYVLTDQPFTPIESNSKEPQKGTVKNWIYDYHMNNRGKARRTITDRDHYLEESENAKNLSHEERQKVAILLESFDESTPLDINTKNKSIIYNLVPKQETEEIKRPAIGEGLSKRSTRKTSAASFRDKFKEPEDTNRRPQLKHDEIRIPLHAEKSSPEDVASENSSQQDHQPSGPIEQVSVTQSAKEDDQQQEEQIEVIVGQETPNSERYTSSLDEQITASVDLSENQEEVSHNNEESEEIALPPAEEIDESEDSLLLDEKESQQEELGNEIPQEEVDITSATTNKMPSPAHIETIEKRELHPQDLFSPTNEHNEGVASKEPLDLMDVAERSQITEPPQEEPNNEDGEEAEKNPHFDTVIEDHHENEKDVQDDITTAQTDQDAASDDDDEILQKKKPKRSPFQMKPIK